MLCATLSLFASCGQSQKDLDKIKKQKEDSARAVEIQHLRDDSIKNAAVAEAIAKIRAEDETKDSLQKISKEDRDSLKKADSVLIVLKTAYEKTKADLTVAYDQMNQIKGFHLLRNQGDRDNQIRQQDLNIQSIRDKLQKIQLLAVKIEKYINRLNYNNQKLKI